MDLRFQDKRILERRNFKAKWPGQKVDLANASVPQPGRGSRLQAAKVAGSNPVTCTQTHWKVRAVKLFALLMVKPSGQRNSKLLRIKENQPQAQGSGCRLGQHGRFIVGKEIVEHREKF